MGRTIDVELVDESRWECDDRPGRPPIKAHLAQPCFPTTVPQLPYVGGLGFLTTHAISFPIKRQQQLLISISPYVFLAFHPPMANKVVTSCSTA